MKRKWTKEGGERSWVTEKLTEREEDKWKEGNKNIGKYGMKWKGGGKERKREKQGWDEEEEEFKYEKYVNKEERWKI